MADESTPDWRLLAPHRPLPPGDDAYVARPTSGGDAIAAWINAGGNTVLVSGPTGVGKSTELAHATQALSATRFACLIQVDRLANMHRLRFDGLMAVIAVQLARNAQDARLALSQELKITVDALAGMTDAPGLAVPSPLNTARLTVEEVARVAPQGRIALLLDGLEKLLPGPAAREIFDALAQLPDSLDLVVVIPWHAAFGSAIDPILRAGERLHRVPALDTDGPEAHLAREFFGGMLARRLWRVDAVPDALDALFATAFQSSGGIPRVFLQLIADAATYARVKRGAAWPESSDLRDALSDQMDSFRRALLPGDTEAINAVVGTDGRELDLERRVRLMAQGILLERTRQGAVSLEAHPLVAAAIQNPRK